MPDITPRHRTARRPNRIARRGAPGSGFVIATCAGSLGLIAALAAWASGTGPLLGLALWLGGPLPVLGALWVLDLRRPRTPLLLPHYRNA